MTTIKITAAQANEVAEIMAQDKTVWLVADVNQVYAIRSSRTEARAIKAACEYPGQVVKANEVTLEAEIVQDDNSSVFAFETHGLTHCPACSIHLSNGIGEHLQDVNGKAIKHNQFQFECLACGTEFGPKIENLVETKPAKKSVPITHHSEIPNPCKTVWGIATDMKEANLMVKRAEVLAACVAQGIAYYTARTQYQSWLQVQKEMAERIASQAAKTK